MAILKYAGKPGQGMLYEGDLLAIWASHKRNLIWLVAIICMVADHVGKWGVNNQELSFWLQCVGRVGLPTWGYALAIGARHTSNLIVYIYRVGSVAVLSVLPYWYLTGSYFNPVFSLLLGLIILYLMQRDWSIWPMVLLGLPFIVGMDWYMCFVVVGVYISSNEETETTIMVMLTLLLGLVNPWNVLGLLGIIIIRGPHTVKYRPSRWVKYSFYPVHLVLLAFGRYLYE